MKKWSLGAIAGLLVLGCFLVTMFTACPEDGKKKQQSVTTYKVEKKAGLSAEYGDFTISVPGNNPSAVAANADVVLIITPKEDCHVVDVTVEPGQGVTINPHQLGRTFKMPARNVTVAVTFAPDAKENEFTVTKGEHDTDRGNFSFSPIIPQEAGAVITVSVDCYSGFEVDNLLIMHEDFISTTEYEEVKKDEEYTFFMPAADVTIFVNFKPIGVIEEKYSITAGTITPADSGEIHFSPPGEHPEGTPILIIVSPALTFTVKEVKPKTAAGAVDFENIAENQYRIHMPAANVIVDAEFQGPPEHDLAGVAVTENPEKARASAIRTASPLAPIQQGFNGSFDNFTQIQGAANLEHWFAVDLGKAYPIRMVRIVWGLELGSYGNFNGMVRYDIQIADSAITELPEAGTYDDTGWITLKEVSNPGNDGAAGNTRNSQERVNTHRFTGTPQMARFIRIKQKEGLSSAGNPSATRPWTDWPAISMFQVFAVEDIEDITAPIYVNNYSSNPIQIGYDVTGLDPETRFNHPVWKETAPVVDSTEYAPPNQNKYKANLTSITPAVGEGGKFAPKTEYKYTFKLQALKQGDYFTEVPAALPRLFTKNGTVNGNPATTLVSNNTQTGEMVVSYTFPATENTTISSVDFIAAAKVYPRTGATAPSEDNFAPAGAHYTAALAITKSADGTAWGESTDTTFADDTFYRYTFTIPAEVEYDFDSVVKAPYIVTSIPAVTGGGTTTLTVVYNFDKTGSDIGIDTGNITMPHMVPGEAKPALNQGNFASASSNFTAQFTNIAGPAGADFISGGEYVFTIALANKTGYKFVDNATVNITVNGTNSGVVYAFTSDTAATITYTFKVEIDNRAINLAFNRGATASSSGANTGSAAANAFDGDATTNNGIWQANTQNGAVGHLTVDLGANYDIGSVVIYQNPAYQTNGFREGSGIYVAAGTIDDTEIPGASSNVWGAAKTTFDSDNKIPANGAIIITLPAGVNGRYVSVRGPNHYARIHEFEVYSTVPSMAERITVKTVTSFTNSPEPLANPPAIGEIIARGNNFDVEFVRLVSGNLNGGKIDFGTVYTYELKLIADDGFRFSTAAPSILGTAVTPLSNNGYEIVLNYTFPATISNIISAITYSGMAAPFADLAVPTSANLAAAGARYSGTLVIQEFDGSNWDNYSGEEFVIDSIYRYNISLTTTTGYVFAANPAIPQVGGKTAADVTRTDTTLTYTYTFEATEGITEKSITFTNNGNKVDDSAVSGLVATATLNKEKAFPGDEVIVKIEVTGTSKIATVYTAKFNTSVPVEDLTFIVEDGSSPVATRNIGGLGNTLSTAPIHVNSPRTGEKIGEMNGTVITQPLLAWTFVYKFTMPISAVELELENTFRYDIAPAIVKDALEELYTVTTTEGITGASPVKTSGFSANASLIYAQRPENVFDGVYGWAAGDIVTRWLTANGATNPWIMIDLGKEYEISDVVLRWHSHNAFPVSGYRIDVSNDATVWTAAQTWGDGNNFTDTNTTTGWRTAWSIARNSGTNTSRYHALFKGDNGAAFGQLSTITNGGVGPYTAATSGNQSITFTASSALLKGRYLKLHCGGAPNNSGVGAALWNFEIYGTPVTP